MAEVENKRLLALWSDPSARKRSVAHASKRKIDPQFAQFVSAMNRKVTTSVAQEQSLALLTQPGTVTVVTGQQLGLFLGPLFTYYKALTAVTIARQISREFDVPAVPIFWLQSEDHDFEEIASTFIPASTGELVPLTLHPSSAERISVAYQNIGEQILELLNTLKEHLHYFPEADTILAAVTSAYTPGATMSDAFRSLMSAFLAQEGLIFFDPRWEGASSFLKTPLTVAFDRRAEIEQALLHQGEAIRSHGGEEQVHVRPRSPLFFFHPEGKARARYRLLEQENGSWICLGDGAQTSKTVPENELKKQLQESPEKFSSSALLRPLVQDSLFPTAVYVGGEAELNYFQQIQSLYPLFGLEPIPVAPRAHFLLMEPKAKRFLDELGIEAADLQLLERELLEKLTSHMGNDVTNVQHQSDELLTSLFSLLSKSFEKVDKTLLSPLEKTEVKMRQGITSLTEKYTRAVALKDDVAQQRLAALKRALLPAGKPQERVISPLYFLSRFGRELQKKLLQEIQPGEEKNGLSISTCEKRYMKFSNEVLAISPHPDDAELFCGGFLAASARQGHRVVVVDLTQGEMSSRGDVPTREKEALAASKLLGLTSRENLKFPDGAIGNDPTHISTVVEVLRRLRPEILLVPYRHERHPDHVRTNTLLREALFFSGVKKFKASGEVFTPRQVLFYSFRYTFQPTVIMDISPVASIKYDAARCYKSQLGLDGATGAETLLSSPLTLSSLEARDQYFGAMIGVKYGEPYLMENVPAMSDAVKYFREYTLGSPLFFRSKE